MGRVLGCDFLVGKVVPFLGLLEIPTNDSPPMEIGFTPEAATCWRCNCGSFDFRYYTDGVLECSKCYTEQVGWDERA